jgi:HD-GYP domain-containing protein (c-di-GMP phosphodiesterase class II)
MGHKLYLPTSRVAFGIVDTLLDLIQAHDPDTALHCRRTAIFASHFASTFGVPRHELQEVHLGALLHDIGKVGVPSQVILKPGSLSDTEWVVMREHPAIAKRVLSHVPDFDRLSIPYGHHERWDGSGYPQGIAGRDIPFHARIFAVIDVWDAMVYDRPYRTAIPRDEALRIIGNLSGSHFDPEVVEAFLRLSYLRD